MENVRISTHQTSPGEATECTQRSHWPNRDACDTPSSRNRNEWFERRAFIYATKNIVQPERSSVQLNDPITAPGGGTYFLAALRLA
ncbi:hypothetical protein QQF64_022313 [Cirrhinus molitorella]|uniref:Uncharacterized protein n=1 Tax=Cirrhinus molitorella TaxID=172907 RepID=A0ABR3L9A9_9TELE